MGGGNQVGVETRYGMWGAAVVARRQGQDAAQRGQTTDLRQSDQKIERKKIIWGVSRGPLPPLDDQATAPATSISTWSGTHVANAHCKTTLYNSTSINISPSTMDARGLPFCILRRVYEQPLGRAAGLRRKINANQDRVAFGA